MSKLIAVDLDLTLLTDDLRVDDYTIDVLRQCKAKGYKIAINTIRSLTRSIPVAKIIEADYINCFSGNYIAECDYSHGFNLRELYCQGIDKDRIRDLVTDLETVDGVQLLSIEGSENSIASTDAHLEGNAEYDKFKSASVLKSKDEILELDAFKMIFSMPNSRDEKTTNRIKEIATKFGLMASFSREAWFFRIMPKISEKWYGLEKVAKYAGVTSDKIICFGDDVTDQMSLENSGMGVKMSNSVESILKDELIKYITLSNNESGVAKFLEDNVL